jgi:hypothetical protein
MRTREWLEENRRVVLPRDRFLTMPPLTGLNDLFLEGSTKISPLTGLATEHSNTPQRESSKL